LQSDDVGAEFGSGRSTSWFALRIGHLTSVEHNSEWHGIVTDSIGRQGYSSKVNYHLASIESPDGNSADSEYVKIIDTFDDEALDFALVDGVLRDHCALRIIHKIRPGGMLIIDNANLSLPCVSYSPGSRTESLGPDGPIWSDVWSTLKGWRQMWTTNGVFDTAIFFKPLLAQQAEAEMISRAA